LLTNDEALTSNSSEDTTVKAPKEANAEEAGLSKQGGSSHQRAVWVPKKLI